VDEHCGERGLTFENKPGRRCVWLVDKKRHVTTRRLDGAIPSLDSPDVIWEIKEYWGKKNGCSKMSDALYECGLVGLELRQFEERVEKPCALHMVFLDGEDQWASRKSDLKRFIDLFHQGLHRVSSSSNSAFAKNCSSASSQRLYS
jgi:hypothetical protein